MVLKAENITKRFRCRHGTVVALDKVSVEIGEGEFVGVVGPSGSGKSTLLMAMGGMSRPDEGAVLWGNQSVYEWRPARRSHWRGEEIGFVFQWYNLIPYLTVYENISVGLRLASLGDYDRKSIDPLLEELGLSDRRDHRPAELSVGQTQRVALARALIKKPRLLLADEPTGNLDPDAGREVLEILKRRHSEGCTVVVITHDPSIAKYAQRIVRLAEGRVAG